MIGLFGVLKFSKSSTPAPVGAETGNELQLKKVVLPTEILLRNSLAIKSTRNKPPAIAPPRLIVYALTVVFCYSSFRFPVGDPHLF